MVIYLVEWNQWNQRARVVDFSSCEQVTKRFSTILSFGNPVPSVLLMFEFLSDVYYPPTPTSYCHLFCYLIILFSL